jgi:hypothetical protein
MTSNTSHTGSGWIGWILRLVGVAFFGWAFCLPAVRAGGTATQATIFPGWKCASIALTEMVGLFGKSVPWPPPLPILLVILSGWINPLIAVILVASLFSTLRWVRRILAVGVVLCMVGTWYFFEIQKVTPLIGHWFWIAGALLILLPDAVSCRRDPASS